MYREVSSCKVSIIVRVVLFYAEPEPLKPVERRLVFDCVRIISIRKTPHCEVGAWDAGNILDEFNQATYGGDRSWAFR